MPKVSVIIPVYNVEKYLRQCLDSIINQTLKDIEIICIDDKSTDNSLDILKEYAQKDSRFVIIEQSRNQKQGAARNTGMSIAKGEYVFFLDPDDWIGKNGLNLIYRKAIEEKSDIVLTGSILFYEDKNSYETWLDYSGYPSIKEITEENFIKTFTPPWGRLYKKSFIQENYLKFVENCYYEDNSWGLFIALFATNIAFVENFYFYRRHNNATSFQNNENILDWLKDCQYFYNFIKIHNLNSDKLYYAYIWYLKNFMEYYKRLPLKFRLKFLSGIKNLLPIMNIDRNIILNSNFDIDYKKKQNIIHFTTLVKYPYIFLAKDFIKNIIKKIFSIRNSKDKSHKIITIFGLKIKIKRETWLKYL